MALAEWREWYVALSLWREPSQLLGDGNSILNKRPWKLLILAPFVGLQFVSLESSPTLLLSCQAPATGGGARTRLSPLPLKHDWNVHASLRGVMWIYRPFDPSPFDSLLRFDWSVAHLWPSLLLCRGETGQTLCRVYPSFQPGFSLKRKRLGSSDCLPRPERKRVSVVFWHLRPVWS